MTNEWVLLGLAISVAFISGFLLAMAETSLSSLRRWQLRSILAHPDANRPFFEKVLEAREPVLAVFVLGNAISIGILILCGLWMMLRLQWAPEYVFAGLFVFLLFFTEVLPKSIVLSDPARWAMRLQHFLIWNNRILGPPTSLLMMINQRLFLRWLRVPVRNHPAVNDGDIEQLLELASQKGSIGIGEKEIISAIINLDRQTAGDVMNPRLEIDGVEVGDDLDSMIEAARKFKHRRLILYRQNKEHIAGFINTRALLLTREIESAFEVPSYVPDSMNLLKLFVSLQRQRRGIAVVLDEFGTPSGIITMEDILEEVVGNIQSEGRPDEQLIKVMGNGRWLVRGNARIEDFQESCAKIKASEEVDTMAGLFLLQYQLIPKVGDSIVYGGFTFTILQADEKRIIEMEVQRRRKASPHPLNRLTPSPGR
jgi:CBS domain containing-hemolysin-like protein